MERFRRRLAGVAASVAAHLLALAVLAPVVGLKARPKVEAAEASAPLMIVELVRPRMAVAEAASQPTPPGPPKRVSLPDPEPEPAAPPPPDPEPPGPTVAEAALDIDPIYRVPFRDAVAQADARLRAGLDCAHVDMNQLPQVVLELCGAAQRLKAGAQLDAQ